MHRPLGRHDAPGHGDPGVEGWYGGRVICSIQHCARDRDHRMATSAHYLTFVAVGAVLLVLVGGLWNMTRENSANLSQKLMRWRVGLQFLAIMIIMLAIWLKRG
jgi:uncharacterized membrane protein